MHFHPLLSRHGRLHGMVAMRDVTFSQASASTSGVPYKQPACSQFLLIQPLPLCYYHCCGDVGGPVRWQAAPAAPVRAMYNENKVDKTSGRCDESWDDGNCIRGIGLRKASDLHWRANGAAVAVHIFSISTSVYGRERRGPMRNGGKPHLLPPPFLSLPPPYSPAAATVSLPVMSVPRSMPNVPKWYLSVLWDIRAPWYCVYRADTSQQSVHDVIDNITGLYQRYKLSCNSVHMFNCAKSALWFFLPINITNLSAGATPQAYCAAALHSKLSRLVCDTNLLFNCYFCSACSARLTKTQ